MRGSFLVLTLLLLFEVPACLQTPVANSQKFEWKAGLDGFLDNREYFSIDIPQTIFGSRAWGEVGASLSEMHHLSVGMNYLYEFGHDLSAHTPVATMYYTYDDEKINFQIGSFPRRNLLEYPIALLSDTLQYYRPNIQGAYLGYRGIWGYQNVFIDWTSRQTDENPETFLFGFSGKVQKGILFLNHHLLMGHFARKGIPDPDYHLRDNGGFHITIGTNLSDSSPLDSLSFSMGTLVSP